MTEGLANDAFALERCDPAEYQTWKDFVSQPKYSPEEVEHITGVPAAEIREAARLYARPGNSAIYYGLGVTEHSQGSTMVIGMANLAMATGNLGREGVGVSPLRGQNNVQGSCDMGSFPHELSGYRHISDAGTRALFEKEWGVHLESEPGLRIPNMFDAALDGSFKGMYIQGEDFVQSDPNTQHIEGAMRAMECVVVQDLFLNGDREVRARLPAGIDIPRKRRHVHQCRAAHSARSKGHAAGCGNGRLGNHVCDFKRDGLSDELQPSVGNHG